MYPAKQPIEKLTLVANLVYNLVSIKKKKKKDSKFQATYLQMTLWWGGQPIICLDL